MRRQIIFTHNGTDSLNLAIHGLLQPGDHAICTDADHNSVCGRCAIWKKHGEVEVTRVGCDAGWSRRSRRHSPGVQIQHAAGGDDPRFERNRCRSNRSPKLAALCRQHGARFLVDAAQTFGHLPLSVDELHADLLAAPGHKGLLGPLGTGVLYIRAGIGKELRSIARAAPAPAATTIASPIRCPTNSNRAITTCQDSSVWPRRWRGSKNRGVASDPRSRAATWPTRLRSGLSQIPGVRLFGASKQTAASGSPGRLSALRSRAMIRKKPPCCSMRISASKFAPDCIVPRACTGAWARSNRGGTVRFSIGAFNTRRTISTPQSLPVARNCAADESLNHANHHAQNTVVSKTAAFRMHAVRRLLHRRARLCVGERRGNHGLGEATVGAVGRRI